MCKYSNARQEILSWCYISNQEMIFKGKGRMKFGQKFAVKNSLYIYGLGLLPGFSWIPLFFALKDHFWKGLGDYKQIQGLNPAPHMQGILPNHFIS